MQVILYQDVPNLGRAGEIVNVKEGYGRNYLVPRKLAVAANPANIKELEHQKRIVSAKQTKLKKHAEGIAAKMKELSLTIAREAGEEEKLFGAVTSKDIVAALRNEGFVVDRHDLELEAPIKQIGIYDIPVRLHAEVTGIVKVWDVKK